MMAELIESLAVRGSAPGCPGLVTLGRTLNVCVQLVVAGLVTMIFRV